MKEDAKIQLKSLKKHEAYVRSDEQPVSSEPTSPALHNEKKLNKFMIPQLELVGCSQHGKNAFGVARKKPASNDAHSRKPSRRSPTYSYNQTSFKVSNDRRLR